MNTLATQERLDEIARVSSSLTKVLGLNPALACSSLKLSGRVCRPFGSHKAQGISLRSCVHGGHPVYTKKMNTLAYIGAQRHVHQRLTKKLLTPS